MEQPNFGGELRRLRQQRGLSLKKFAQVVHYDPGYLSKIENGGKPPTVPFTAKCDAALEAGGALSAWVPTLRGRKPPRVAHEVRMPVVIRTAETLVIGTGSGTFVVGAGGTIRRRPCGTSDFSAAGGKANV